MRSPVLEQNPSELIRTLPQRLPTGEQLTSQLQAVSGVILTIAGPHIPAAAITGNLA